LGTHCVVAVCFALGGLMCLPACVTETVKRKPVGTPAQRVSGGTLAKPAGATKAGTAGPPGTASLPAAALPSGPIAAPATAEKIVDSRVVVAVRPLGVVPFDSLTLPLISPDGRWLATQVGDAPGWATVLAGPTAEVPRTTVRVFDLSVSPPKRAEFAGGGAASEAGLMLGRDADERGVLVESQRGDGSRWIGRLLWDSGAVEWLVRDTRVNAHAVFGPAGELVFTRREVDGSRASLVVLAPGGDGGAGGAGSESVLETPIEKSSFAYPCVSGSGLTVLVFMTSPSGTEARAYPLGVSGAAFASGVPVARRAISPSADPMLAYQAVAASQPQRVGTARDERFVIHHPVMGRMAIFDASTGLLTAMAERSIAGVWDEPSQGLFLTTPRGLVHQRIGTGDAGPTALPEARVLSESWVARATGNAAAPFVLIGPGPKGQPGVLQVTAMEVVR
jgi:hypothetical protein